MNKMPFVPIALPLTNDKICYSKFMKPLSEAYMKIGSFNEKLNRDRLKSTYAIQHLLRLESLYSTKIEGTQTTIDEIYESEIASPNAKQSNEIIEVQRYNEALKLGCNEIVNQPISNKLIKSLHYVLLNGNTRKNSNFQAGEFRTQQNYVGSHMPPAAVDVPNLMGNLERYINEDRGYEDDLPPLIKAALIHAQFETIHPFPDGNGRVGRVIIPLYLFKQGVIKSPYFFLSQELEKNQTKYYALLQGTRALDEEGFTKWICFFLSSVINQTSRDIDFIDKIENLNNYVLEKTKSEINSNNIDNVVDAIFKQPIFTCEVLYKETGIAKSSLRKYINILEKLHIVYPNDNQRNRKYYFVDLIDLLK